MANIYEKKITLNLTKMKKSPSMFTGRTYYKDEKGVVYMSQKADKFDDQKYVTSGNKVFANANNKIGEPEFALSKERYAINIK